MKTLAKLNNKGFTVQDIIESGFSFKEYDSLVSEVYNKVQVGENESKGFIVESAIPPTFLGDSLYKIVYPLTSTLKGVDTFNYDSGVPSQGGYFPLYNPSKENILVGDTDLKASGIKNTGIFNIEGALSFERVSQENFIEVSEDFFNWRSYFYRVNITDNSEVIPIVEKNNTGINDSREILFQRKSPLGTYDIGVLDSETFGTTNDRLIWVIPIKNFSKGNDNFFSFSFYLNKRHSYIKDTDIQFISTKTQITDVDTFRQVMFDNSGVIILDNLDSTLKNKIVGNTDTRSTFTTSTENNYYNLVNNEWQRLAVSFDFSDFTTSNAAGYYNYIIVRFTPGTSNNVIPKSSFLQVCAPMFERGCLPSPFEVIREKKNTNSLFEVFYKYPLLFNFNRFNTSLTENILSLSKKWLISYKRKFESTLTTQKGTFIDSLGGIWWGYGYKEETGNLQVTCSSGNVTYLNGWNFDSKNVLNKWESVFIYPTEDKKICIEVYLEDKNSYKITVPISLSGSEDSVPMGTLVSDIKYHLNLGGCFEGNTLKKYNGYYKDLLFLIDSDSNSLDIQKAIKEINSNSLALHSKKVWDKETNKQESATILQTNSLKEGF